MTGFRERTRYTPLWETWCDTCNEGVSPDHQNNCAYCGTRTRRNHQANQHHPGRYPTIPDAIFDAARKANRSGIPINEFARSALKHTGRRDAASLAHTIRSEFYRRGWPVVDSATASRMSKARYKQRLALGERPDGLCTSTNRFGKPCKRHATPGTEFCNLHDPAWRDEVQAAYALNVKAARRIDEAQSWSEYAPRVRMWFDTFGHGARRAAARRADLNPQTFDGLLDFELRGVDRPITSRIARRLDYLLTTEPSPRAADGLKRRVAS